MWLEIVVNHCCWRAVCLPRPSWTYSFYGVLERTVRGGWFAVYDADGG